MYLGCMSSLSGKTEDREIMGRSVKHTVCRVVLLLRNSTIKASFNAKNVIKVWFKVDLKPMWIDLLSCIKAGTTCFRALALHVILGGLQCWKR